MNIKKTTTADLIDEGGKLKAEIATLQGDLDNINDELKVRVAVGEAAEAGLFRAAHVQQANNQTAWKSIATKLNASRQMIAANTKKGKKDFIKYTARKTS